MKYQKSKSQSSELFSEEEKAHHDEHINSLPEIEKSLRKKLEFLDKYLKIAKDRFMSISSDNIFRIIFESKHSEFNIFTIPELEKVGVSYLSRKKSEFKGFLINHYLKEECESDYSKVFLHSLARFLNEFLFYSNISSTHMSCFSLLETLRAWDNKRLETCSLGRNWHTWRLWWDDTLVDSTMTILKRFLDTLLQKGGEVEYLLMYNLITCAEKSSHVTNTLIYYRMLYEG